MRFLPFYKARSLVKKLGIKNVKQWYEYNKSGNKRSNIPANPNTVYKHDWKGWGDWLGTGTVATKELTFRPFEEAKTFVRTLGLKSSSQWNVYSKSDKKPSDIPAAPSYTYRKYWKGWGDWLGVKTRREAGFYCNYEDAKRIVHALKLKNQTDWRSYVKTGRKDPSIPSNPNKVYRSEWIGFGDWLGTGVIAAKDRKYRSFELARDFVHNLGLQSQHDWRKYCKSPQKPGDIPSNPHSAYKKQWKGMGDWLGTGTIASRDMKYLGYKEAKTFVHSIGLKSRAEWDSYLKSGKKPGDIPSAPQMVYKKDWKGTGDWLGTGAVATNQIKFQPFEQARHFIHNLRLANSDDWKEYRKSGKMPLDIPSNPNRTYKKEWKGIGDWLGTGSIASFNRKFRSFEQAREFVSGLGLENQEQWIEYCRSGKKPQDIPNSPGTVYENRWKGFGDWLGTGYVAAKDREYRHFELARNYIHSLGLKSWKQWSDYSKSGKMPQDIPAGPSRVYKKHWEGWGDWLGTGSVATRDRQYRSFNEAREFVHSLELKEAGDWLKYCRSKDKPADIPASPVVSYKNEWISWPDWLGYEERTWTVNKVKDLLRSLIESKIIYQWDEAVLYSFLLRKGVLSLEQSNRHKGFFKNLIEASRTIQGRDAIEAYASSDSELPPDLSDFVTQKIQDVGEEIQTATTQELAELYDRRDPLDYGEPQSVEQILANTSILESISVDEEAMQFYLTYSVDELWKCAFREEKHTLDKIRLEDKNGNKYHDTVMETFLSDYQGTRRIEVPKGYAFPYNPTLMQSFVAYKVKSLPFFGNFSGTGAGKTLSAVLASRVIDSKMTLIVCPNDVVGQWASNIMEIFPDSVVITGKEAFYRTYDKNKHQYLVLNYDKFSQEDSPNLILNFVKEKVDFVVLDEIHFTKVRYEEDVSKRRQNLDGLMTAVRKKNSQIKVLGLSATPVVNNLTEGKSLLELITGKIYEDIATRPTIPNAVTLYEKLSTISVRELPRYDTRLDDRDIIEIQAERPQNINIKQLKRNPLAIEQFLTDARIPEIVNHIDGQTIIYTEYVTDVVEKLSHAVEAAGYSYALYTGEDHSGLKRFLDKKVQILIASRPISVGVDGLQKICNRLILNTLPWTNAQYQQLLGRLVRKGQIKDVVHVYIIKASIGGYPYDDLKWKRIQFKRTLADCAVDGRLPEKNLITPQQAAMEAVKWLERLERGEISSITRRDLNVELTPVEIQQRIRKYGDFTRLNNRINTENSRSTHRRMVNDPREWEEYHRQYREARKTWSIIPYQEIIKRIKELSTRLQVGDFGCGEAKIVEAIGKERVYSFDHIAIADNITACDMKSVPLPNDSLDVAVFSLSLMGKNWPDYISEAKRCLATNGYLLIAETTKSLSASGRLSRLRDVIKENGFEIYNDEQRGDFTFIEAREL